MQLSLFRRKTQREINHDGAEQAREVLAKASPSKQVLPFTEDEIALALAMVNEIDPTPFKHPAARSLIEKCNALYTVDYDRIRII